MKISKPLFLPFAVLLLSTPAIAEDRLALVIGNSKYESAPLRNPQHDADAMAAALQPLGFEVFKYKDLNNREMSEAVRAFRKRLTKDSLAFFFFAGHGMQVNGVNYLVPIGATIREEEEVHMSALTWGVCWQRLKPPRAT